MNTDIEEVDQNTTDHDKGDERSEAADPVIRSTRSSTAKGQQNIAIWAKTLLLPAPEDVVN